MSKRFENTFTIKCEKDIGAMELAGCLEDTIGKSLGVLAVSHHKDFANYKKGFDILIEYFDSIADEEKEEVDKLLKECGL